MSINGLTLILEKGFQKKIIVAFTNSTVFILLYIYDEACFF